ncbi:MAG: RDD family protein [Gammaproteobacteria bacterium]
MSETIATNEEQDAPTAGLLRRLAALLYDAFLVAAIWMALGFGMQFIVGPDTNQLIDGQVQTDPIIGAILFIGEVASAAGFYMWFWLRTGQTLGMIAWRIKAVNASGQLMSPKQAILRFVLAWPSFFCLGVGYLWMYIDKHGNAIHDILSGTQVVVVAKGARNF